jgi:hypothetical protein
VIVEAIEARSRANPAMPNSPARVTFPEVVTVWDATVAPDVFAVPDLSTMLNWVAPASSYRVMEPRADALAATFEVNDGAASLPAAVFVQIATRDRAVAAEPISSWFVHPVVPPAWAVAAALVVALNVMTATSRFPAARFCPVPKVPATVTTWLVMVVLVAAVGVPTLVTAMGRCSPPG